MPNLNKTAIKFHSCISDADRAKDLLIGTHQWYLNSYQHALSVVLLKNIENMKPWNHSLGGYNNFEDVYAWVASWLSGKYISQMTIYDVALRLIVISGFNKLLPSSQVYLHTLPLLCYRWFHAINVFPVRINNVVSLPFSNIASQMAPFNAWQTEIFLCYVGKVIRDIQGNSGNKKTLSTITVDDVLKKLQQSPSKRASVRSCC